MNTNLSPQKENPGNSSEAIRENQYPFQHDPNISDGGEFLDDGIRMTEQPFREPPAKENEQSFSAHAELIIPGKINKIFNQPKRQFMFSIRQLSFVAIIAAVIVFFLPQDAQSQSSSKGVKNVVLVHGAFADGSSWSRIIPLLQAKGLNVIAVQNPLTSFADDVAAAKRAIAQMDGPVLLVGHSYGGMVISEAGKDPKVAGLLYVAALVPEEGQSVVDVNAAMPTTGVEREFRLSPEGFLSLSLKAVNESFAQDVSPEERKIIFATQVTWAASATLEKVYNPSWKSKPSWYIVAASDGMINPDLQRFKAKLIKATTVELTSGHVPMVSQPNKVAEFIIEATQKL
jgi:pimeloyl-ACP methyl ester carboxylesterase